jgi:hypothetical protein
VTFFQVFNTFPIESTKTVARKEISSKYVDTPQKRQQSHSGEQRCSLGSLMKRRQ